MNKLAFFLLIVSLVFANLKCNAQSLQFNQIDELIQEHKYDDALSIMNKVDSLSLGNDENVKIAFCYRKGLCFYNTRKYESAIPWLIACTDKMIRQMHDDTMLLESLYILASSYSELQQYANAEKYYRKVIIRSDNLENEHEVVGKSLKALSEIYTLQGKTELADLCLKRNREARANKFNQDWEEREVDMLIQIKVLESEKRYNDAIALWNQVLKVVEENAGKNSDRYLVDLMSKGADCASLYNRYDIARETFLEVVQIGETANKYNEMVWNAYISALRIFADDNDANNVSILLPKAELYYSKWKDQIEPGNFYEFIAEGFYNNDNFKASTDLLQRSLDKGFELPADALEFLKAFKESNN